MMTDLVILELGGRELVEVIERLGIARLVHYMSGCSDGAINRCGSLRAVFDRSTAA